MSSPKILIDFEKIKDPFSGLGQFCAHLKTFFDQSGMNLHYWQPGKFQKLAKKIPLLLPPCDVYHAVHQDSPYMPWSKKPKVILTIHDLNALYEQTQFGSGDFYKQTLQKKIDRADVVTFISAFTRSEVENHFDLSGKQLEVIYNGISLGDKSSRPAVIPDGKFIFTVGTVLPKKNFHVLIEMMKLLPEYKLVIAGTTFHAYAKDMIYRISSDRLNDRIFLVGTVNEAEKLWYYENACAFVFPSLLEGFGLPVAEAMSKGLPLFLSQKTSLPEIGGKDAFYFDSFEPARMASVFKNGMGQFSPAQKERLIQRSALFNWKKAADAYLSLYQTKPFNKV